MRVMKTKQFLLSVLLIGLILAAGCVGKNTATGAPEKNTPSTPPAGEAITVDTSSIDTGITNADKEQAEFTGDVDESALDLGI